MDSKQNANWADRTQAGYLAIPSESGGKERNKMLFSFRNKKIAQVLQTIYQVRDTDVTVLIEGESGVGKELIARSVYCQSVRKDKPFIKVNCAALPEHLLESELFGYERGAFTGAYRAKPGKFELANGGTIFLDEIAEISLSLQPKLLQVVQDGEFSRLGGRGDIKINVRTLAATNRNLKEYVRTGRFREDLFYRLNVVKIHIPPLRERKEEIPFLVHYFLQKFSEKYGRQAPALSQEAKELLMDHEWPGNIRELENMVKRLVVFGSEDIIKEELNHHPKKPEQPGREPETKRSERGFLKAIGQEASFEAEREIISRVLEQTRWNRRKTAEILGVSYNGLRNKIKGYGLDSGTNPPVPEYRYNLRH